MALMIGDECIACDACVSQCPNGAIEPGDPLYVIDPNLCTECMGTHQEPLCVSICPVECIVPDPDHQETDEELLLKHHRFQQDDF